MADLLVPLWQIEPEEYRAVCAYLRLTPHPGLYDRLLRYLADASARSPGPAGFARYLAVSPLTRFRIGRLDAMTKLFLPGHPMRYILNGVVALHECDARGYRELAIAPLGRAAWPSLFGLAVRFVGNLALGLPWLAWQWAGYALSAPFRATTHGLDGARVLITGVNRGLGRDLLLHCLECGAEVVGVVRNGETRDKLQAELPARARVTLLAADLSTPGTLVSALRGARIAPESLTMAVVSAGIKRDGKSVLSLPELRETFEVNFFAAAELIDWLCASADAPTRIDAAPVDGATDRRDSSAPPRAEKGSARAGLSSTTRVILISSMGRWHGMHFSGGYNASKAALSIWGESLDLELRTPGTMRYTVTIVEPGMFASGMTRQTPLTRALFASRPRVAERIIAGALAGRSTIRPPLWFALLTWAMCLTGRGFRARLLTRAKPPASR